MQGFWLLLLYQYWILEELAQNVLLLPGVMEALQLWVCILLMSQKLIKWMLRQPLKALGPGSESRWWLSWSAHQLSCSHSLRTSCAGPHRAHQGQLYCAPR